MQIRIRNLRRIAPILPLLFLLFQCETYSGSSTRYYKNGVEYTGKEDIPCAAAALTLLEQYDKAGYRVYEEMVRVKKEEGRRSFLFWLDCENDDYDVGNAVHESVHGLTGYRQNSFTFFLPSGKYATVKLKSFFPRSEIAPYLDEAEKDIYFHLYMTGRIGAQDLLILLDELNAYTFSVINATALATITKGVVSRDGLASMMLFLQKYLHHARLKKPADYAKIAGDETYLALLKVLWENAEKSIVLSADYQKYGGNDRFKLKRIYSDENMAELTGLFENSGLKIDFDAGIRQKYRLHEEIKPVIESIDIPNLDDLVN